MKLHLPLCLRKALLVCLAIVASSAATISTTVASVSGIGAVILATGQQASASVSNPADSIMDWTDQSITSSTRDQSYDASGNTKYTFGGLSADPNGYGTFNATSDTPNIYLTGVGTTWLGVNLRGAFNAVYMDATNTRFNVGEVNADIKDIYVYGGAQFWVNRAALTGLTANFHLGSGTGAYWSNVFNATPLALEKSLSTTGYLKLLGETQIVVCEGSTLSFGGAAQASGQTLHFVGYNRTAGTLELKQGGIFGSITTDIYSASNSASKSADELKLLVSGGTLELENGGHLECKLEFTGESTGFTLGGELRTSGAITGTIHTLTMKDSSSWNIGRSTLTATNVSIGSAGAKLVIDLAAGGSGGKLSISGITLSGDGKLTLNLVNIAGATDYELFASDTWSVLRAAMASAGGWEHYFTLDLGDEEENYTASIDENGHLQLSRTGTGLTWSIGSGTWSADNFAGVGQQTAGRNITFSATGADSTAATVTITGEVSAQNITVKENAKYTFSGGTKISTTGALAIGGGAEVKVNTGLEVAGETTLDGTLEVTQNHVYTFAEALNGGTSGVLKGYGNGGILTSCSINLNKGGELANLDVSWGVTLNLGADLILHDWHFSDASSNRFIKFARDAAHAGDAAVNLVLDFAEEKTVSWHYDNGTASKGSLTFDNVGLEKRGEGALTLKETEGASNGTHWNIQNLKVTAGTLKIDDSQFTVVDKLSGSASLELLANAGLILTGGTDALGFKGTITMGSDTSITLGSGAKLKANTFSVGAGSGTVKLTVGENFTGGFLDFGSLTIDQSGSLKIVLTDWSEEWKTGHADGLTIFYGESFTSWLEALMDRISFWGGEGGDVDLNDQVTLDPSTGKLTWTRAPYLNDLYWGQGAGSHHELTLGEGGSAWSTSPGTSGNESWIGEKNVHLEAQEGSVAVTVAEGATMNSLSITGSATYNFTASGAQTATVTGALDVGAGATLSIGSNVTLEVGGSYSGDGTLQLAGGQLNLPAATIKNLAVTEAGGTLKLGGNATIERVSGEEGALIIDGSGDISLAFTQGGILKSLTQAGTGGLAVRVNLAGEMTLKEGGSIGGELNLNANSQLKLGGSFTTKSGISGGAWSGSNPNTGTKYTILSEAEQAIDFTICEDQSSNEVMLWGGLTMGDEGHRINLVKKGSHHQSIAQGEITIWGDVRIEDGVLRLTRSANAQIHGALTGAGELYIMDTTLTVDGKGNELGGIRFSNSNKTNVLKLAEDLVVGEIGFCDYDNSATESASSGSGAIQRKEGVGKTVYILMSGTGGSDSTTLSDFFALYQTANGVTLDEGIGIGLKVVGGATKSFTEGAEITQAFKLTGGGTLKLQDSAEGYTFTGGLTLDGGTLELGGTHTVKVGGSWGWTDGTTLKISSSSSGLKIDLTGLSVLNGGQFDGHQLTLDLSSSFLVAVGSGYDLFDWDSDLSDYFVLKVDGQEGGGTYANLQLDENGRLTWGEPLIPAEMTWYTQGAENTWNAGGGTGWGEDGASAWDNQGQTKAIFDDGTGEEVTISGTVRASSVEVKGGGQAWAFVAAAGHSLTVEGTLRVGERTKLAIGGAGGVEVRGGVILGESASVLVRAGSQLNVGGTWTFGERSGVQMESDSTLICTFSDATNFLSLVKNLSVVDSATGALLELAGEQEVSVAINENITLETGLKKARGGITLTAQGGARTVAIKGEVDLASLSWIGDNSAASDLILEKGGYIHGDLSLTQWGELQIGEDLILEGSMIADSPASNIYAFGSASVYVLLVREGEKSWTEFVNEYQFGLQDLAGELGYGKAGSGDLTFTGMADIQKNFKVAEGSVTFLGATTMNGHKLVLGDHAVVNFHGELTANLTALTLGNHATVSIARGNALTLTGSFSWGEEAQLDLGSRLTITLDGSGSLTKNEGNLLTIDLSGALLSEAGSGGWRLFRGWDDVVNWAQYIRFTVDGREASTDYENLGLDEEGYLTWNSTPGVSHSDFTGLNYDDMMPVVTAQRNDIKNLTGNKKFTVEMASYAACQFKFNAEEMNGNLWLDFDNSTVMGLGGEAIGAKSLLLTCTRGSELIRGTAELWTPAVLDGVTGLYIDGDHVRLHVGKGGSTEVNASYTDLDLHLNTPTWESSSTNDCYSFCVYNHSSGANLFSTTGTLYAGKSSPDGSYTGGSRIALLGGALTVGKVEGANLKVWGNADGKLELTQGGTLSGAFVVQAALNLEISGGTLKVNEIRGDALTSLTLGKGAKLEVGSGTLRGTTLDVSAGGGSLTLTMVEGGENLDFTRLTLGENGKLGITLKGYGEWNADGSKMEYRLFQAESFATLWDALETEGKTWRDFFTIEVEGAGDIWEWNLDDTGLLTFSEISGSVWSGDEGDTWSSAGDWENGHVPREGDVVVFTDSASNTEVVLEGEVRPGDVKVRSGSYTFVGDDGGDDRLVSSGRLTVSEGASLKMQVESSFEQGMALEGELFLDANVTVGDDGKIEFNGGKLSIGAGASNADSLNDKVDEESSGMLRLDVGTKGLGWGDGSEEARGGVRVGLENGVEKGGTGDFTMAWRDSGTEHGGDLTVNEGSLTLEVEGSTVLAGAVSGVGTLRIAGGEVTLSGSNNTVAGIEVASGATLKGANTGAFGDGKTQLTLSGGTVEGTGDEAVKVGRGGIIVNGTESMVVGQVELAGDLISEEDAKLTAAEGAGGVISGSLTNYRGSLDTADEGATWTLSGSDELIMIDLGGAGSYHFVSEETTLSGVVSGTADVVKEGKGRLVLTGENTSSGDLEAKDVDSKIELGQMGAQAKWAGDSVKGAGDISLRNVELTAQGGITAKDGAKVYVDTAMAMDGDGGVVDVNGMDASSLDGITINQHGQLTGLTGTYEASGDKQLSLAFTEENMSSDRPVTSSGRTVNGDTYLIESDEGSSAKITVSSAEALTLDFSNNAFFKALKDALNGGEEMLLHVLKDGTLEIEKRVLEELMYTSGGMASLLSSLGLDRLTVDGGDLVLTGQLIEKDVYFVTDEPGWSDSATIGGEDDAENPNGYGVLADKKATVLDNGQSLTVTITGDATRENGATNAEQKAGGLILHNLVGGEDSSLTLHSGDEGIERRVILDNTYNPVDDERLMDDEKEEATGQDTLFEGSITSYNVQIEKTGKGTLIVGGNYNVAGNATVITEGALVLNGEENRLDELVFSYGNAAAEDVKRGLKLGGGGETTIGRITEAEGAESSDGNEVVITGGTTLTLTGESTLESTTITGCGSGTLTLAETADEEENVTGASLTLRGEDEQITGVGVKLDGEHTVLDVGKGGGNVTRLEGNGTLKSNGDDTDAETGERSGTLTVGGGTFSGTLGMSEGASFAGSLQVEDDTKFTLDNVESVDGAAWDVNLGDGASLIVDVGQKIGDGSDQLTLGDIDLGNGRMTVDFGGRTVDESSVSGNITRVDDMGTLTFNSDGNVEDGTVGTGITVDEDLQDSIKEHVMFTGTGNFLKEREVGVNKETGEITITTKTAEDNKFERLLPNMSRNAEAGATMVWDSLKEKDSLGALIDVLSNPTSDYARMANALIGLYDNDDKAGLEKALVAVAGSSTSVLAPAMAEDMHRQLTAIRNRTTMLGGEQYFDNYDIFPIMHAWLNAEGAYRKLDADGFAPGYTLNSWGGTVGMDVDVSPRTTVGLALTAMYGDLKTDAADSGKGDMDTAYVTGFVRKASGAWIHTFVLSAGLTDVNLKRTVTVGSGAFYTTKGDTDGYALGALYEVGYTKLLNKAGTLAIQSVANVEVRHVGINGYTEKNSDAGLTVDDMDYTVVTLGAGARMQAVVGENAWNRYSVLEGRLLVKGDLGDRSGAANNALTGSNSRGKVESAEVGAIGIEAGVGLTIPLGSQMGNLFIDGSVKLRENQTSFDATLGYRISF